MVLRGRWCNIIVLNVPAPTEEKSDDSKDSLYEELEQVFDHCHDNCHDTDIYRLFLFQVPNRYPFYNAYILPKD
jgi:hypothetical protein